MAIPGTRSIIDGRSGDFGSQLLLSWAFEDWPHWDLFNEGPTLRRICILYSFKREEACSAAEIE